MAKFTPNVLRALKACYTLTKLENERTRLATEVLSGVQVTSLGMDNASGSAEITASPAELLDAVQTLIDQYGSIDQSSPSGSAVDFSLMTFGT